MRIVTWNCNLSLGRKLERLLELKPDIAVIQECEQILAVPSGYSFTWCGNNPRKGLGVLCKGIEAIVEQFAKNEWTYFLPVSLPEKRIRLLATWAYNHRAERFGPSSIGNPLVVLKELAPWLAKGRSIMAGDFNNTIGWDKPNGQVNFAEISSVLTGLGLDSAYHTYGGVGFGAESSPTFYHTKNIDKPFHIDYCFVHRTLAVTGVLIPQFSEWRSDSDHVPVVIDLSDE